MPKYELTERQVQNLKSLIMDANIKGSVASAIVELLRVFNNPVVEAGDNDLHSEHNDRKENGTDRP